MRKLKLLGLILSFALIAMVGCGSDDPSGPIIEEPEGPMIDALEEYWTSNAELTASMEALNTTLDEIEVAFEGLGRGERSEDDIEALVNQYLAQSEEAATKFDVLLALEDDIHSYGRAVDGERNILTDAAGAIVRGVYNTGKKAVVSSGQMVRTTWRVLSGSHSLREALSSPDSGIPIVSNMAQRLQEHNARKDDAITYTIVQGDTQEGFVPVDGLEGDTPEELANSYRNLPDDHPLKKQIRGDVHLWDGEERLREWETVKKAARDNIKDYAGAISGSEVFVEVTDQMLSEGQNPADTGTITPSIEDIGNSTPIGESKTVIISKRNQPEDEPKIAILDGVDPEFEVELPGGQYDIVVIADGFIRTVEMGAQVAMDTAQDFLMEMYRYAENSVILESITASPETVILGETATVSAVAASTIGGTLSFEWTVAGGTYSNFSASGASCSFKPDEIADYTVSVTVTGSLGGTKSGSTDIAVTGCDVQITDWSFSNESFNDGEANPGEQLGFNVTVSNAGDTDAGGTISFLGLDGITVTGGGGYVNVPAGGSINVTPTVTLPVDYSLNAGCVEFNFEAGDVIIVQDMAFAVEFYVEMSEVNSPVTDRILTLSGVVANPSLTTAHLVIDNEFDEVYEVNLSNGIFSQQVALEASSEEIPHTVLLSADSGSWHEEDTMNFTSQIPPAGFRVTLTWNTGGTDVDLWVTDPFGNKCYYLNTYVGASGLTLDFDDTNGYGPENITTETPPAGNYFVQAHYYSDHDPENAINSSCTIVIRLNEGTEDEETLHYYGFLGDTGDVWNVTTITIEEGGLLSATDHDSYGFVPIETLPAK